DEASEHADENRGEPIAATEHDELLTAATPDEALGNEAEAAAQQRRPEHTSRHRVDPPAVAVPEPGREPDPEERHRCAPEEHPTGEARLDVAQAALPDRSDRLEDRAVGDVRPDRQRGLEAEQDDEDRGHQRAAAHS